MAILSKEIDCQLLCRYLQVRGMLDCCVILWLLSGLTHHVYIRKACYIVNLVYCQVNDTFVSHYETTVAVSILFLCVVLSQLSKVTIEQNKLTYG